MKDESIRFVLEGVDKELYIYCAKIADLTLSQWIRGILKAEVKRLGVKMSGPETQEAYTPPDEYKEPPPAKVDRQVFLAGEPKLIKNCPFNVECVFCGKITRGGDMYLSNKQIAHAACYEKNMPPPAETS